jgi:hypothetical protein
MLGIRDKRKSTSTPIPHLWAVGRDGRAEAFESYERCDTVLGAQLPSYLTRGGVCLGLRVARGPSELTLAFKTNTLLTRDTVSCEELVNFRFSRNASIATPVSNHSQRKYPTLNLPSITGTCIRQNIQ